MAEKSIGRRMYENVMGTPEQNAAAEKRMEERDKKNPDSLPAKINKAAKAVTGKNSEPQEEKFVGSTLKKKSEPQEEKFAGSTLKKKSEPEETNMGAGKHMYTQTMETIKTPKKDAGKNATENMKEYGMKKGGMTASARADGIAQRGKTRGKIC
jgi:hypothetical protein